MDRAKNCWPPLNRNRPLSRQSRAGVSPAPRASERADRSRYRARQAGETPALLCQTRDSLEPKAAEKCADEIGREITPIKFVAQNSTTDKCPAYRFEKRW